MNDNEDIRRALADLAGNPAPRDLKPGVHQRVAGIHRRRQGGTAVALSAVTLVAGLTVSRLPALRDADPVAQSPASASISEAESSTAAATTSPSAAARKKPTRGIVAPTATARSSNPATRPATGGSKAGQSSTTTAVTGTTSTAPTTIVPTKAATSAKPTASLAASATPAGPDLSKEELGATLAAVTDPDGSVAPYTTLTLRVQGKIYGSLDDIDIRYRTAGSPSSIHRDYKVAGPCAPQTGQLHDVDESVTFRYRFRLAGSYTPAVTIRTWDQNCTTGLARREWTVQPTVEISTGSSLSNGPEPIVVNMSGAAQGGVIALSVASSDPDGYIRTATVDWGAGSATPEPLGGDSNPCDESGGRYWPDSWTRHNVNSPVLPPGSYTVTATVTSTGCDGKDSQSATKQVTVVVG